MSKVTFCQATGDQHVSLLVYEWTLFLRVVCLCYRVLLKKRIERLEVTLNEFENLSKQHRSAVAYFESLASHSSTDDSSCVICFEDIIRLTVTPCGHMFCNACIKSCVVTSKSCPTCRKNISEDQLIEVKVWDIRQLMS